jgi:hypothetical protein
LSERLSDEPGLAHLDAHWCFVAHQTARLSTKLLARLIYFIVAKNTAGITFAEQIPRSRIEPSQKKTLGVSVGVSKIDGGIFLCYSV